MKKYWEKIYSGKTKRYRKKKKYIDTEKKEKKFNGKKYIQRVEKI